LEVALQACAQSRLTEAEAQDAVQETVIKVSKHIGRFRYDPAKCSFRRWLMLLARQRIAMQFQKRQQAKRGFNAGPGVHSLAPRAADDAETATWTNSRSRGASI